MLRVPHVPSEHTAQEAAVQRPLCLLAGSHDTMTYCLNKTSPISQAQSRLLQLLGKVLPCVTRPVVLRWSTTQVLVSTG